MLSRRLTVLTIALCLVILVTYHLEGPRRYVVLIPSGPGGGAAAYLDHKQQQQQQQQAGTQANNQGLTVEQLRQGAGGGDGQPGPPYSSSSSSSSSSSMLLSAGSVINLVGYDAASGSSPRIEFVVSAVRATNTSWIGKHFPGVPAHVYIADDPKAPFTVLKNIGHESNVYLTYLIDHYDDIPDVVIFLHGGRYQWHNEDPLYDGVPPLQKLRIPYVLEHGFATLRCSWLLGCPLEIRPDPNAKTKWDDPGADQRAKTEAAYAKAFTELFPGTDLPEAVGVHCGAQFAVTRDRIRQRSRAEYVSYRDWLWTTDLTDEFSGRVMEYTWHQILGAPAVDCPHAETCFCEKFGMCDLRECHDYGCEKTYFFKFGELPPGWPEKGPGEDGWPVREWADPDYVPPPPPPPPEEEKEKEKEKEETGEGEAPAAPVSEARR